MALKEQAHILWRILRKQRDRGRKEEEGRRQMEGWREERKKQEKLGGGGTGGLGTKGDVGQIWLNVWSLHRHKDTLSFIKHTHSINKSSNKFSNFDLSTT